MCDITHSYVWRDSFTYVTWLIHMWQDYFLRDMTHLYQTCDMSDTNESCLLSCVFWNSYVTRHDSFESSLIWMRHAFRHVWYVATWPICLLSSVFWKSHVTRHDSFISDMSECVMHSYETWLIHRWHDKSVSWVCGECLTNVWHVSLICDIHMRHDSFIGDMTRACTWQMSHSYVTCLIYVWHVSLMREDMTHSYGVATISRLLKT